MKSHKNNDNNHAKNDHESRIVRLEVLVENIGATLVRLETKMDEGFNRLDKKIDDNTNSLRTEISDLNKKMDSGFNRLDNKIDKLLYFTIGGFAGILAIMAHGFHWF
jgi:hypothetical protein